MQQKRGKVPLPPKYQSLVPDLSAKARDILSQEEEKRQRNTAASARFRLKKKEKEKELAKVASEMTTKCKLLEARVKDLEEEVLTLKSRLRGQESLNNDVKKETQI
jgi:hypothetical protein